jgi:cardiolipin synthase
VKDELRAKFDRAHCQLRVFRPLPGPDNAARNHRKVFVIDGRVGFTGGFGVDDKWLGDGRGPKEWRDTNVRVEGPAVAEMQQAFGENWQEPGGDFLPPSEFPRLDPNGQAKAAFVRSDAAPVVTRAERLTQLAIASARKRVWIENAYFAPSKAILDLLGRQAAAGVDVRMVVAGRKSDSKLEFLWAQMDYGELQKRGVRIWEYQASMIHSKTMLVDDSLVIIGSVNLEPLSLNKLEDGALVAQDETAARKLAKDFEEDCARSKEQK